MSKVNYEVNLAIVPEECAETVVKTYYCDDENIAQIIANKVIDECNLYDDVVYAYSYIYELHDGKANVIYEKERWY